MSEISEKSSEIPGFDFLSGAEGAKVAAESEAKAYRYNAQLSRYNAKLAAEKGVVDEARSRATGAKILGSMKAGYGASGVQMEGSALDVLEESAANAEMDAQLVKHGAKVNEFNFLAEAKMNEYKADAAITAGKYNANAARIGLGKKIASASGGGGGM